jgi:uncharacterized protein (UPF0548 family)
MFLFTRPSKSDLQGFIDQSRHLQLSYDPIGIARESPPGYNCDLASEVVGHGRPAFERAKLALINWRHYELQWAELLPRGASIEVGTNVAVLVRHLGFWSLNGCRVVYGIGDPGSETSFGFAYGTLRNHAEMGEETFEVVFDPESENVIYRIRAVSRPRAFLAWLGYPITRVLQERFRRDSIKALRRAVGG